MRHLRMVGLCLVAVLAIAAVTATSASALPEWGKCTAKAKGKYSDGNCTVKAKKGTGTFEWTKGKNLSPVKFTGKSVGGGGVLVSGLHECFGGTSSARRVTDAKCVEDGGKAINATEGGFQLYVECASEASSGEATGSNAVGNVSVTFKGCAALGFTPCTSAGAEVGEIKTNALKGKLGYISKAAKEVGVVLEPAKKHGLFAEFNCPGLNFSVAVGVGNSKEGAVYLPESKGGYDQIISPITPVNTMTNEYTQVYSVNINSENIPNKFDGQHVSLLEDYLSINGSPESSKWSPAGEEITNVNTPEEEGEIKA